MGNMINKTLKQINTNILPQNNVPMVPEHLQTQNLMPAPTTLPGVQTPPQTNYQGGMGNQMGTYPLAQVASSTYVDNEVHIPGSNLEINKKKSEDASNAIKLADQAKYDKVMDGFQGVGANRKEAIKQGNLTPDMLKLSDEDLSTALINRDYNRPK